jgi:hypothetical protein
VAGPEHASPGFDAAAGYITRRLAAAGLTPAGDNGGFRQYYDLHETRVDTDGAAIECGGVAWRRKHWRRARARAIARAAPRPGPGGEGGDRKHCQAPRCHGGGSIRGRPGPYTGAVDIHGLPGADLIERGLCDLAAGIESDAALLVRIGAPRLRRLGLAIPPEAIETGGGAGEAAEHRLYQRLARADVDSAHSRYNALIRTLVSFEQAAECAN